MPELPPRIITFLPDKERDEFVMVILFYGYKFPMVGGLGGYQMVKSSGGGMRQGSSHFANFARGGWARGAGGRDQKTFV
jgi:hypothetical protein